MVGTAQLRLCATLRTYQREENHTAVAGSNIH